MTKSNSIPPDNSNRLVSAVVGIVAWNEEENIQAAIDSLLQQTLFADLAKKNEVCQIICVCNGCVDNTVSIARNLLEAASRTHPFCSAIAYKMVELEQPSKTNALNHLFQIAAPDDAEMLIVMDADITLHAPASLSNLCAALRANPKAWFSIPAAIKQASSSDASSAVTSLSEKGTALHAVGTPDKPNWVPGQLYCVRRAIAKAIYFPKELMAEDMFLSMLAHTHFLSNPSASIDKDTIVKAANASYVFAPYLGVRDILSNQKRQAMAHVIQELLVEWADAELDDSQKGTVALAKRLEAQDMRDAGWIKQRLETRLQQRKLFWKLLPNMYYTWPLRAAFEGAGRGGISLLPVAFLRTGLHLAGLYLANSAFRRGQTYFWADKRTSEAA